jgi:hypothetical protein
MSFIFCDILIYVFPACFEFSKAGLYHLASHVCSLSHNAPLCAPPPPPPLLLLLLWCYSLSWTLVSNAVCLWPLPACFLFLLFFKLLQPHLSVLYWSFSFSCSFHFSCCNLFWHSLVLHSFNILDGGIYKFCNIFSL